MESKKIVTIGLIAVVVAFGVWYGMSIYAEQDKAALEAAKPKPMETPKTATLMPTTPAANPAQTATAATGPAAGSGAGQQTKLVLTEREIQLMKMQQEAQAQYLQLLDQLQTLRVQKDIAETNKDIMKAKMDAVFALRKMNDLLAPPAPPPAPVLDNSKLGDNGAGTPAAGRQGLPVVGGGGDSSDISVVSVTNLQGRWMAVLNTGGKLISVAAGDKLESDNSIVLAIDRSGIWLEKNGIKRKVTMMSFI